MIREINIGDVRKNFSELINEVRYLHDSIILKKGDKSVAVIIDITLFDKLQSLQLQSDSSNDLDSPSVELDENILNNEQEAKDQDLEENLKD